MQPTAMHRCAGALLGLACGDAVGTAVEFCSRGSFSPVTGMHGGGPFGLRPGQWTDDTSMALCLAESLLVKNGFDALDQMARYVRWYRSGYLSPTGHCFDIGRTVESAIRRFEKTGDPYAGSASPDSAGNGALMRLAPVAIRYFRNAKELDHFAVESSRTTHAAPEALDCVRVFAHLLSRALQGQSRHTILAPIQLACSSPKVAAIATASYLSKTVDDVFGTGYAVASLEAALWCFHSTPNFEQAVLAAANLGDDADTTAAITGQIAGAYYGIHSIPQQWRELLHMRSEIEDMAYRLFEAGSAANNR